MHLVPGYVWPIIVGACFVIIAGLIIWERWVEKQRRKMLKQRLKRITKQSRRRVTSGA